LLYRDFPDQVKVWEDSAENLVSERQNGNSEVGITADPSLIATMKVITKTRITNAQYKKQRSTSWLAARFPSVRLQTRSHTK
jgi:hypothetical protein